MVRSPKLRKVILLLAESTISLKIKILSMFVKERKMLATTKIEKRKGAALNERERTNLIASNIVFTIFIVLLR